MPRIEHVGVLSSTFASYCRAGRMLACPGAVSNKIREVRFGVARSGGGVSRENDMESRYTCGVGRFSLAKRNRGYNGMSAADLPWRAIVWG